MNITSARSACGLIAGMLLTLVAGCGGGDPAQAPTPPPKVAQAAQSAQEVPSDRIGANATAAAAGASSCPHVYVLPAVGGCNGVLLTDPQWTAARTGGIVQTVGPRGLPALRFGPQQTIDLRNEACLQLGRGGSDFSVTMWLKASDGQTQILSDGISQYGGGPGFILYSLSTDTPGRVVLKYRTTNARGDIRTVDSVPFDAGAWTHVTVTLAGQGANSRGWITINGQTTSDFVWPDVHTGKLRIGEVPGWSQIDPFEVADLRSWGRRLTAEEARARWVDAAGELGFSAQQLGTALADLRAHVDGSRPLNAAGFAAAVSGVKTSSVFLPTNETLLLNALNLLDTYESRAGALFVRGGSTAGGIADQPGNGASQAVRDARGMLDVFQAVHDDAFSTEAVAACGSQLQGRGWATANHFPGQVTALLDASRVFTVRVNATVPARWGRPVIFSDDAKLRPTGLYLPPGSVAQVSVPPALVGKGFAIHVGAHSADHTGKDLHRRLHRVTRRFEIVRPDTPIANPLGGGVYIEVPYLANAGMVAVQVRGVVEAPLFSTRSFDVTSAAEWQRRRGAGVPWTDVVSDRFMMQVPSNWVYARDDLTPVLRDWDTLMEAMAEFVGIPVDKRNDVVAWLQPDLDIRGTGFGVGYPQANAFFDPNQDERGNSNEGLVSDILVNSRIEMHELGHAQLFSKFVLEEEALVNLPFVYAANTRFGWSMDEAFRRAMSHSDNLGFTPDRSAVDWMVTQNFAQGAEMQWGETAYQQRGFAKYFDIARLFGWKALTDHYRQENEDYQAGLIDAEEVPDVDTRILRLSIAAGTDLTPLIHFWGVHPVDPTALRTKMLARGLTPSTKVRDLLLRYQTLIPRDRAAFLAHFNAVYPGMPPGDSPDFGPGWYQARKNTWDEREARKAVAAVNKIVQLYWPRKANWTTPPLLRE